MQCSVQQFEDFHLYGASAPEWQQRYHQLSRGEMRSSLLEISSAHVHIFRKSLNRRVVQQGCLPQGQICFAFPAGVAGPARMQGREITADSVLVLRSGSEFTLHRPEEMELLAITFDNLRFEEFLDASGICSPRHPLLAHPVLELPARALRQFRATLERALSDSRTHLEAHPVQTDPASLELLMLEALTELLGSLRSSTGRPPRASSASFVVEQAHRYALSAVGAAPSVDSICKRLRTSRRTVQNSFRSVAETTPVHYLRSLRLNAVRRQLLSTASSALSVSQIASGWGFSHLGHFSAEYKSLFGQLPSQTRRNVVAPS